MKIKEILSIALSGVGIYLIDKLLLNNVNEENLSTIGKFFMQNFSIRLYQIFLFIIFIFIFIWLIKRLFKKKQSIYTKEQEDILKINQKEIKNIILKYEVYFDDNDKPKISDLTPYCNKHKGGFPLRMQISNSWNYSCILPDCSNHVNSTKLNFIKNIIESELEHKYEKMK